MCQNGSSIRRLVIVGIRIMNIYILQTNKFVELFKKKFYSNVHTHDCNTVKKIEQITIINN